MEKIVRRENIQPCSVNDWGCVTPSGVDRMVGTRIGDSLKIETNGSPAVLEKFTL